MTTTTITTTTLLSGIAAAALLLPGCTTYVPNNRSGTALSPKSQTQSQVTESTQTVTIPNQIEVLAPIEQTEDVRTLTLVDGNRVTNMTPEQVRALTNNAVVPPPSQILRNDENTEIYVVKKGDTLIEIANKHGLTSREFIQLNNIKDPNRLSVGQKLKVPVGREPLKITPRAATTASGETKPNTASATSKEPPKDGYKYHTVEKGDSLSVIAYKNGVKTAEVAEWNNIQTTSILRVGQHLRVNNTRGEVPVKPVKTTDNAGNNDTPPADTTVVDDNLIDMFPVDTKSTEDGVKNADKTNIANNLGKDTPVNPRPAQPPAPAKSGKTYTTTSPEEDVFSISLKHGVLWREIVSANPGLATVALPVGTIVNIPETTKKQ